MIDDDQITLARCNPEPAAIALQPRRKAHGGPQPHHRVDLGYVYASNPQLSAGHQIKPTGPEPSNGLSAVGVITAARDSHCPVAGTLPLFGDGVRMGHGGAERHTTPAMAQLLPVAQSIAYHGRPGHHCAGCSLVVVATTAANSAQVWRWWSEQPDRCQQPFVDQIGGGAGLHDVVEHLAQPATV